MGLYDAPNGSPGRIAMIVDNDVHRDSRVQKIARSAAEAGWDVTLLGCSRSGLGSGSGSSQDDGDGSGEREWRLGGARVRVLPLAGAATSTPGGLRARLLARGGAPLRLARLARRPIEHAQVWFWTARERDRAWRHLEPGLWNYERTFAAVLDDLRPDIIHAHDFRMIGVGARAVDRARSAGRDVRLVWDAHEFLPGVRPGRDNARWLPAHRAHEREYAHRADAVITVSDALADLLQREHNLPRRPHVVLNAPEISADPDESVFDLRALCGIGPRTPLLVYAGSATAQRGLGTVVAALPTLDGVHVALVVGDPDAPHLQQLRSTAAGLGVADRLHVLPYVHHHRVVRFLSAADAGLIPIHHWPNHEIALITKFFEYSHARLPIVVSDVKTMAETVRATGQGEVFRAQDAAGLARAVRAILADPGRYRAAYDAPDSPLAQWTWEAQAATLDSIYRGLSRAERSEASGVETRMPQPAQEATA